MEINNIGIEESKGVRIKYQKCNEIRINIPAVRHHASMAKLWRRR